MVTINREMVLIIDESKEYDFKSQRVKDFKEYVKKRKKQIDRLSNK